MTKNENEVGTVRIANEVVGIIASLAATEVEGVAGMSGGIAGGIAEMLKKKSSKGVKVEVGEKEAAIDLYMIVEYGSKIPDVAWQVQDNVRQAIEDMTGLKVVEVNVHVQGINFEEEEEEEVQEVIDETRVK
ncbi:Asp23/Gls24 family envelope stress response protein [Selenihalanaerobacter shriftii]|uniref:Uncharacterized conserved protein YloU, alkaline shock protein (Asp23) family n=1 Tax=Selenihalanaerobacter shriftii TaxID=142842 RepID=A0A1T4P2A8_9FIRM|nr:Asp23/Gls24 family envelope stress response protein [Selenihalanaerobacter shriftii]SJZ85674.1 Uncharacterized conserved protein YloU, alkaline shock protein (Asp23) family [Selenihalanaerobacter shriftii]